MGKGKRGEERRKWEVGRVKIEEEKEQREEKRGES